MKKLMVVWVGLMSAVGYCGSVNDQLNESGPQRVELTEDIHEDLVIKDKTVDLNLNNKTLYGTIWASNAVVKVYNGSIISTNLVSNPAVRVIDSELYMSSINLRTTYHGVRLDGNSRGEVRGDRFELINNRKATLNLIYLNGTSNLIFSGELIGNLSWAVEGYGSNLINCKAGTQVTLDGGSFRLTHPLLGKEIENYKGTGGKVVLKSWKNILNKNYITVAEGYKLVYDPVTGSYDTVSVRGLNLLIEEN